MIKVSLKVLVVDDDSGILANTAFFLEEQGFNVSSVKSAEEATELLTTDTFDVAIVDVRLPGMDGFTLIQKAHVLQPRLKYLINTGSRELHLSKQLLTIGLQKEDVYYKPIINMQVLVEGIRRVSNMGSSE